MEVGDGRRSLRKAEEEIHRCKEWEGGGRM